MALSFRTLSFTLSVLSTMLLASLALGACQDSTAPHEQDTTENADVLNNKAANSDTVFNTDTLMNESTTEKQTAEQEVISNLSDYRWTLMSAMDDNSRPLNTLLAVKDQVRLSFNQYQGQNTLSYSVGCNTISASYQLQGSVLTIQDSMSTKMSCNDLDTAENDLIALMQGDSQLVITKDDLSQEDQPILTQLTSEATTLVWEGNLTAQAKYNTKGETIFWAVSAKNIPCDNKTSEICLQVKPITYDDQGIKSGEGEWTSFAGEIDGYQHNGQHDEVLRLQRYHVETNTDDNASGAANETYAYVLDAVIESAMAE